MGAEAPAPDGEQRPEHEQARQHEPWNHAGEEQAADRGLGGDAVEDEGDRGRDQDAERAAGAYRAGGDLVRIAAPAHLRDAHLADGGAARRDEPVSAANRAQGPGWRSPARPAAGTASGRAPRTGRVPRAKSR